MIRTVAGLALVLTAFTVSAQNPPRPSTTAIQAHVLPEGTVTFVPDAARTCPIDMHASRGVWDHTVRVRNGKREPEPPQLGQRITLSLKDDQPSGIVSATVRIRGMNGKNRMMLTPAGTEQDWNAVTTLRTKFFRENDGSFSADLRINGFTAVHSVELIRVLYADGSSWSKSDASTCRVQPDPLMLITER